MSDLIKEAKDWIAGDPDPETARLLEEILGSGDEAALRQAMIGTLEFGTAGIRGRVGPGPAQMNRAVVMRTTRGLADFLLSRAGGPPDGPVVVGFDARPTSRQFAEDTVGVLAAAGIETVFFADFAPTPLVAYAARVLGATAAVVVTASHNPPADNGYKVYDANAAQIIPPTDRSISSSIRAVGPAREVPRMREAFTSDHINIKPIDPTIFDRYWSEVDKNRPVRPDTTLRIVYTPLHGVGGATVRSIFNRTIHQDFHVVSEQFEPDGRFPTVKFPNPEEPGALDLAMRLGTEIDAELILANDPDADRLAAAVPVGGRWRLLTGNELGALLGSYLLDHWEGSDRPITANSVVSSPMLAQLAASAMGIHLTTLTGFKWIVNAALATEAEGEASFLFGYEEALGFSVGRTVRDKDGISAALVLADLAALEKAAGYTLLDTLARLWKRTGIWVSTQRSIVREGEQGQDEILRAVDLVAASPPEQVGGYQVTAATDFRTGAETRPPWLGAQPLVELMLGDDGRVLTRPSGTEPKLKIYVDLRQDVGPEDRIHDQRDRLLGIAGELAEDLDATLQRSMLSS